MWIRIVDSACTASTRIQPFIYLATLRVQFPKVTPTNPKSSEIYDIFRYRFLQFGELFSKLTSSSSYLYFRKILLSRPPSFLPPGAVSSVAAAAAMDCDFTALNEEIAAIGKGPRDKVLHSYIAP